jgi:hypothetical protein
MTVTAVLCVITMLRVDWDKEALKAKERLQVGWVAAVMYNCLHAPCASLY